MSANDTATLTDHLLILGRGAKNYTNTRLSDFNDRMLEVLGQINTVLGTLSARISTLETFLEAARLYIDADGNIAQHDTIEIEEEEEE